MRDDRDAVGVGAGHAGEEAAEALDLVEPVVRADGPGGGAAVEGALGGEAHRAKLRGEAGAVEVGDVAGELEQVALVGDVGSVAYPRAR